MEFEQTAHALDLVDHFCSVQPPNFDVGGDRQSGHTALIMATPFIRLVGIV